jgi:hypothetical protein
MRFLKRPHLVSALLASTLLLGFATAAQAANQAPGAAASSSSLAFAEAGDPGSAGGGNGPAATSIDSLSGSAADARATVAEVANVAGATDEASAPSAAGAGREGTEAAGEPTAPPAPAANAEPVAGSTLNAGANENSGPEANAAAESPTTGADPGTSSQPGGTSPVGAQPGNSGSSQPVTRPSAPEPPAGNAASSAEGGESAASPVSAAASDPGDQNTGAAESNATLQSIWQVEISGCIADCRGINQVEVAEEENTTVQQLEGVLQAVSASQIAAAAHEAAAQTTTTLVQLQIGCLAQCIGATTTGSAPLAYYEQGLRELMAELMAALPSLDVAPASDQNATEQTISQQQYGEGSPLEQVERASDVNTTLQIDELSAALVGDLEQALASAEADADQAVNQTEQEIWQLQIGCLMFCVETQQYQLAVQSNTTSQTGAPTEGSSPEAVPVVANDTDELVWQVQIGCIYECVDTTEQQTAPSGYTVLTVPIHAPPATPPPEVSASSPDTAVERGPATAQAAIATSNAAAGGPLSGAASPRPQSDPLASAMAVPPAAIEISTASRLLESGSTRVHRSGAPAGRPIRLVSATVTTRAVVRAGSHNVRSEGSIALILPPGPRAGSPSSYRVADRPVSHLGNQATPRGGTPTVLRASTAAGEGVATDTSILALLAAIVFFALRLSPRRVRPSA